MIGGYNEAYALGTTVSQLHQGGALERMAEAGWGKYTINGFEQIADHLVEKYGEGKRTE